MERSFPIIALSILLATANSIRAEEKVDFEKQVLPIFTEHCSACHGADKALAKLRLHSATDIQEKREADENLIIAGDPEQSELYARLVLPADDKKRMPKGADPLAKEKIDLIAAWIQQGATLTSPGEPAPTTDGEPSADDAKQVVPEPLPLAEVQPAPEEAIEKLKAGGATVLPLYSGSNLLQISFPGRREPVGDSEIALLEEVADQVHSLNIAGAEVTSAGLAPLKSLKNLTILHLENSNVADEALAHLSVLERLEYLNLYGTSVGDEGLNHLTGLKHLRKLYLWQTKASYEHAMSLEKDIPGLVVNLGYDHPVVVRVRLTQEIDLLKAQVEESKAAAERARQEQEAATKQLESASARLSELEKQLGELEQPTSGEETTTPPTAESPVAPAADSAAATP